MSVYQAQGKPLSKEAEYKQKLRQGVYNSPGKPSVGVSSNAPDTAALLAASSDLGVKPSYERLHAAPEAHSAALAVKMGKSKNGSSAQENAGAKKAELGIPLSYDRGSVYRRAQTNSTSTMTSRTTPEKSVAKHGLSLNAGPASALNIGKISQIADKNSSLLLNKRFNPEVDHRSGIQSKPAEFSTQEEEKMAAQSAGHSLTMKHGSGYTDSISAQKRTKTFQAADVVDATLLAAASAKANERLSTINLVSQANIREQAQVYSKALTAAQKNAEERLKSFKAGMVDLGGGLSLPISEVDKLANLIVHPVLEDLNSKASAQREFDQAQQTKHFELKSLQAKSKKEEEIRKRSAKIQRLNEKNQRIQANEAKKKGEDEKFVELQTEQNTDVQTKSQKLRDLQAKFAEEKEALLAEKKENEERISEEEAGLIDGRKEELILMQKEKDEILQPTLDELKVETDKLKDLTDTRDQLAAEVESCEKLKDEYEAKIEELKEILELTKAKIGTTTLEYEDFVQKREAIDKEVKDLQESSDKTLKEVEDSHKLLDDEIKNLKKEKEDKIATKASHKQDIYLQIEKKVKGEHEINKELPEHMQEPVNEDRIRDTGSLFSVEEKKKTEVPKEARTDQLKHSVSSPMKKESVSSSKVEDLHDSSSKKKGFRARLKNVFKTTQPVVKESKSSSEAQATHPSKEHPANAVYKKDLMTDKDESFDNFDEDLSIRENGKKAGLFKEEI